MANETSSIIGSFGAVFASVLSYVKWHSVGYAILHFLCGWFYVFYHILTYGWPHIPKV